ncbi:hypothetical protein COO60DRAFT_114362 [Scenedesmus sp. NREL 46B-D3]|nr:hypothetical protein COO60DRAFT_114362 [Scenedesmus sp. NREL 46B-D3]
MPAAHLPACPASTSPPCQPAGVALQQPHLASPNSPHVLSPATPLPAGSPAASTTCTSWTLQLEQVCASTQRLHPRTSLSCVDMRPLPAIACRRPYIHQLNMAASEVARLHDVPVIDLAGMVFGLEPRQYLQDQHHPNKVRGSGVAWCLRTKPYVICNRHMPTDTSFDNAFYDNALLLSCAAATQY